MGARAVQVSLDAELLDRVDRDPETRERGRSAFVRSAIELYLEAKDRREIDERLASAYRGHAEPMAAEIAELLDRQTWPTD
jgi:metal-responsive CopG/Arc/MetJ family transcriptional regulator